MQKNYTVDNAEALERKIAEVREAQAKFATYTQEQVDKIFLAAAMAANKAAHSAGARWRSRKPAWASWRTR